MPNEPFFASSNPPQYPAEPPYVAPYAPAPAPAPAPPLPPYFTLPPPPAAPQPRRPRSVVAVAVASVAVLVAGLFAAFSLAGSAGASSPEEAVERFMSALDHEDAIGMLTAMTPAERDVLRPTLTGLNEQLARLGIIEKVDLGAVPGFDVEVQGLELAHSDVIDGISRVQFLGGTIKFSTQPDEVPIGEVLRGLIEATGGDATVPEASDEAQLGGDHDNFLVAINDGDGWYLSLAFTIAEQARESAGAPVPDRERTIAPRGAASPEAAVRQLLADVTELNLAHIIGDLPPDEMAALALYAPLFLDEAQAALDETVGQGFSFEVRDVQLASENVESATRVTVSSFGGSVTFDGGSLDIDTRGDCVTMSMTASDPDESEFLPFEFNGEEICPDDAVGDLGNDALNNAFARVGQAATEAKVGFIVVERGGRFYVSPLRTITDAVLQVVGAFDRSDLEEGGALYTLFTEGFDTSEQFDSGTLTLEPPGGLTIDPRIPPPADPPRTDDKTLDALALACWAETWVGCDDLGKAAETRGSESMALYARTCGGRIPDRGPSAPLTCEEIFS